MNNERHDHDRHPGDAPGAGSGEVQETGRDETAPVDSASDSRVERPSPSIPESDSPPQPRLLPMNRIAIALLVGAIIALAAMILYKHSPLGYRAEILGNSSISYETAREDGAATLYRITYTLEAHRGTAAITVNYLDPGAGKAIPGKTLTGTIDQDSYLAFFQYLDSLPKNPKSPAAGPLTVSRGRVTASPEIAPDRQPEIAAKFRTLAGTLAKQVSFPDAQQNPEIKHLADGVDPTGQLVPVDKPRALFYNREDGELVFFRPSSGSAFELGKEHIIAATPDGLCLVALGKTDTGTGLSLWDKRMLHNLHYTITTTWEPDPLYRTALMSPEAAFITVPGKNGKGHDLIRYEYTHVSKTLATSISGFLKDLSPDGKRVMLQVPEGPGTIEVRDTKTGRVLPLPKTAEEVGIIGFSQKPGEYVASAGGDIVILKPDGKRNVVVKSTGNLRPLRMSPDRTKLLMLDAGGKLYAVYDLTDGKQQEVNKTPMVLLNPRFSSTGDILYFTRFDGLFRWKAARE